jgi:hypothetical protein
MFKFATASVVVENYSSPAAFVRAEELREELAALRAMVFHADDATWRRAEIEFLEERIHRLEAGLPFMDDEDVPF